MKKAIFTCLLSAAAAWVLWDCGAATGGKGSKGGKGRQPGPTPRPVYKTPSVNPGIHPVVPPQHMVPKTNPKTDFHLPSNFQRPVVLPKVTAPIVTLPPAKHPVQPPGHSPGGVVGLPRDAGHGIYRPKLPPGTKTITVQQFGKQVHTAIVKRPTKQEHVNVILKKYQPHAVAIRTNLRDHFVHDRWFASDWWRRHDFVYPRWHYLNYHHLHPEWWWWRPATWIGLTAWLPGVWGEPFYYDYGNNVVYMNNNVYVNGVLVAPAPVYAEQAFRLANVPPPPPDQDIDWSPLGVFGLASSQQDPDPNLVLQLAISKQGLISGTCYNRPTDTTIAVSGRVDPDTQRVALQLSERGDIVLETGLYNLTQPQTPVLMHFGILQTQTWFLVRLEQPAQE